MPDYCLMRCEPGMIRPNGRSRPEVSWMKPRFLDNAWGRVVSYIYRGDLPIDHSRLEQKVRPSVVGRNPWLFANTPAGANASALICSLVEMAKANGKEPSAWLCDVRECLPLAQTVENYEALLTCNVYDRNLAMNLLSREQWGCWTNYK